jgi:hypothetical protein
MISSFQDLVKAFSSLLKLLIPLSVGVALLLFLWGGVTIIMNAGDEAKAKEAKSRLLWGVVVLFVMVSIWGIVAFLQGDLLYLVGGRVPYIIPIRSNALVP